MSTTFWVSFYGVLLRGGVSFYGVSFYGFTARGGIGMSTFWVSFYFAFWVSFYFAFCKRRDALARRLEHFVSKIYMLLNMVNVVNKYCE